MAWSEDWTWKESHRRAEHAQRIHDDQIRCPAVRRVHHVGDQDANTITFSISVTSDRENVTQFLAAHKIARCP